MRRELREREIEEQEKYERRTLKKRRRIVRTSLEPVFPHVIGFFYRITQILPILMIVLELVVWLEKGYELETFLYNSGYSGFFCWLGLGTVTLVMCQIQFYRIRNAGYAEYDYRFEDEISGRERAQYFPVNNPEASEDAELALFAKETVPSAQDRYYRITQVVLLMGLVLGIYFIATQVLF